MWGTKSASYNLCVFDLGEQIVNSNECCDEVVKIKTRSEGGDGGKIMGVVLLILMFVWTIMVGLLIVLMEKCQISPEVIATQRWGVENVGMK